MTGEEVTTTLSGYVDTFMSYMTGDAFMTAGFALSAVFIALLALMFIGKRRDLSIWHGLALAGGAFFTATIITNKTNLADWLALGLGGYSTGAMIFVAGMIAMICVMVYNMIATKGRTLVR